MHAPVQVPVPHVRLPCGVPPGGSAVQVPTFPAISQAIQPAVQAWSQQTPSAQVVPAMHPEPQSCPFLLLHAPLASQVPVHPSSSLLVTATQIPPPPVHAWHAPHDEVVQHLPSTQLPVAQSPPVLQSLPPRGLQAPLASQVLPRGGSDCSTGGDCATGNCVD